MALDDFVAVVVGLEDVIVDSDVVDVDVVVEDDDSR